MSRNVLGQSHETFRASPKVVNVRASTRIVYKEERYECPYCKRRYGTLPGIAGHLVRYHIGQRIPSEYDLLIRK